MALDISKLENVVKKAGGRFTARCPACAEVGADTKGEHLAVFADGKFGCVVHPGDKKHRKRIYALAGGGEDNRKISVNVFKVKKSSIIMDLSAYPRFSNKTELHLPDVASSG